MNQLRAKYIWVLVYYFLSLTLLSFFINNIIGTIVHIYNFEDFKLSKVDSIYVTNQIDEHLSYNFKTNDIIEGNIILINCNEIKDKLNELEYLEKTQNFNSMYWYKNVHLYVIEKLKIAYYLEENTKWSKWTLFNQIKVQLFIVFILIFLTIFGILKIKRYEKQKD